VIVPVVTHNKPILTLSSWNLADRFI